MKQLNDMEFDMAAYSYDTLILQSRLGAGETITVKEIAQFVFGGVNPKDPTTVTPSSMSRAMRAATNLVVLGRCKADRSEKRIVAITSKDMTGSVQAEAIMNLVVRGSVDRRKTESWEEWLGEDKREGTSPISPAIPVL